jgi:uncharacterized protein YlxW (UPF0749 family)
MSTSDQTRQPSTVSASLLIDLVTNTSDPGYGAAAQRRRGQPNRFDRPLAAVGCLLVGFTIAVAYVHTNRGAPNAAKVHSALVDRVRVAQASRAALEATAERLADQVNQQRDAALSGSGGLRAELDRDELLAGTTAATGPGLVVRLADPPAATATPQAGRPGTVPIEASALLTDRDVRSVVNQLWSSGAEAISVNDVRLTPTSAIRFAGQAVLVEFQPITSPYTIRAIGDADVLVTRFADSEVASRYHTLAARGVAFSFDESAKLSLPARAAVSPRYASAAPSAGPTR